MLMRIFASYHGREIPSHAYKDAMIHHGASICVQNAQRMIDLIHTSTLTPSPNVIPWWYRIFYLHMAGTVLLAAMLASEIYTDSVRNSWDKLILLTQSHEHLSPFIEKMLLSFQSLATQIAGLASQDYIAPSDMLAQTYFQDIFQGLPFDIDGFFFRNDLSV